MMGRAYRQDADDARMLEAEARLVEWGQACRGFAERLGVPMSTSLDGILHRLKAIEQQRRRAKALARKTGALRKRERVPKVDCPGCQARVEAAKECSACGKDLVTADGKESRRVAAPAVMLPSRVADVDHVVSTLPGWMQKALRRAYLFGQPDRVAAFELKMSIGGYVERRRAAVERVADLLSQRYSPR